MVRKSLSIFSKVCQQYINKVRYIILIIFLKPDFSLLSVLLELAHLTEKWKHILPNVLELRMPTLQLRDKAQPWHIVADNECTKPGKDTINCGFDAFHVFLIFYSFTIVPVQNTQLSRPK